MTLEDRIELAKISEDFWKARSEIMNIEIELMRLKCNIS